ncbi:hypothetical protein HMPREF9419_0929 [Prevotella nigrescens ATCC 33563]|nr:hypothetical protein HMPREF9419_0929 [Prevotella nigrescens ATCC 33563]
MHGIKGRNLSGLRPFLFCFGAKTVQQSFIRETAFSLITYGRC